MKFITAKKLSSVQERKLLKRLLNAQLLGCGSSRLVFIDPRDSRWIVKVAVGTRAFRQNRLEVERWQNFGETAPLAAIKEYGRFCIVMERLPFTISLDDDNFHWYERLTEVREAYSWLEWQAGHTSDNQQLGRTNDGRWVAYDYGFDAGLNGYKQIGWADDIAIKPARNKYLQGIRTLLLQKQPITKCDSIAIWPER